MAHGRADFEILVGVKGGGQIAGESGKKISDQLNNIFGHINKNQKSNQITVGVNIAKITSDIENAIKAVAPPTITLPKIQIDVDTTRLTDQIRTALENMKAVKIKVAPDWQNSGGGGGGGSKRSTPDQALTKKRNTARQNANREAVASAKNYSLNAVDVHATVATDARLMDVASANAAQQARQLDKQRVDAYQKLVELVKQKKRLEIEGEKFLTRDKGDETNGQGGTARWRDWWQKNHDAEVKYQKELNQYVAKYAANQANAATALDQQINKLEAIVALQHQVDKARTATETRQDNNHTNDVRSFVKLQSRAAKLLNDSKDGLSSRPELYEKLQSYVDKLFDYDKKKGSPADALAKHFNNNSKDALDDFLKLETEIRHTSSDQEKLGQKISRVFKEKFGFGVMAAAADAARRAISQLYTNVVQLDDAMAQMKIVTGASTAALKEYSAGAADAAKQTGRTMTEIMASSTEYARLGYSLEESLKLSETTAKLSNVAAIGTEEATSAMTAILKGFRLDASDAELVGDMMTEVANKYAIDAGELGAALERGGASLAAANNSLAESMALMAAGNAAVQNAETVGTAFKTTSMRIRGTSIEELEEAGLATDGLIESTSQLQSKIKALSGVDIMLDADTYKSTYQIMLEIAQVWDEMTDSNQAALLDALAGKRNAQVLMSVIQNLQDLTGAYDAATNAAGAMEEANAIAMDTIQGRSKAVSAAYQELSYNVLDSDFIKLLYSAAQGIIEMFNAIITHGDGFFGQMAVWSVGLGGFVVLLPAVISGVVALKTKYKELTAAATEATVAQGLLNKMAAISAGKWALIVVAASAVFAGIAALAKAIKGANLSLEEMQEKIAELQKQLDDLEDTLGTNNERIEELEKLKASGTATLTTEKELALLREENRLLEAQIKLKKDEVEEAQTKATETASAEAWDFFNTRGVSVWNDEDKVRHYQETATQYEQFLADLSAYQATKEDLIAATEAGDTDAIQAITQQRDAMRQSLDEALSKMQTWIPSLNLDNPQDASLFKNFQLAIDAYIASMSDAAGRSGLLSEIMDRDEWANATTDLMDLAAAGDLTNRSLVALQESNPEVAKLVDYLIQIGLIDPKNLTLFANELNRIPAIALSAPTAIYTMVDSVKDDLDLLHKAQDEMTEAGVLSLDTTKELSSDSQLKQYLIQTANGYKLSTGAVKDFKAAQLEQYTAAMVAAKENTRYIIQAETSKQIAIGATTDEYIAQLESILAASTASAGGAGGFEDARESGSTAQLDNIRNALTNLRTARDNVEQMEALLASYEATATAKGDDAHKKAADLQIRELKHQLEMNRITEEQYYDGLQDIEMAYYKDTSEHRKKYAEEIMDIDEEIYKGRQSLLDDWINDQQKAGERLASFGNLTGQIELQKEVLDRLQEAIDEAYEYGLDENSEYVQKLEDQMREASQAILDITKSAFDDFISYADDFNVWEDLDISKVSVLEQELKEIDKLLEAGVLSWKEYVKAYNETAKELYDTQKESIESIIDLTMEMIEKNAEDEVEALEKQKEAYQELIDAKKELLEKSKDEKDHERDIEKTVRELSKLQEKLNSLRLDDSQQAAAERAKLEEEIYQKTLELQEKQEDYAYESTIDYLDKIQKEKEDAIDEEIEDIEAGVDTWVEVYEEAIKLIDDDFEGLFDDLTKWMEKHRDSIDGPDSLLTAWKNVAKIKEGYASTGIEEIYDGLGSNAIDPSTNSVGTVEAARSIVQQMYDNSVAAKGNPNWQALNAENHELRQEYEAATGQSLYYNKAAGTWHIGTDASGPLLYDLYKLPKYHSGGYVGSNGSINNSEVLSLLERGELVLTHEHQSKLKKIFESIYSMLTLVSPARMSGFATTQGAGLNSEVVVNITHNGSMTDADAKRYGDIVGDTALQKLKSAFNKRGVR